MGAAGPTLTMGGAFLAAGLAAACGARTGVGDYFYEAPDASSASSGGPDAAHDHAVPPPHDARADVLPETGVDARVPPEDAGRDVMVTKDSGTPQLVLYLPENSTRATWGWTGSAWSVTGSPAAPPPRDQTALASNGAELVLFGGLPPSNEFSNDTWTWSGGAWTQASPSAAPSARDAHAMGRLAGSVVLFGGNASTTVGAPLSDTWVWDGTNWEEKHPPTSPPARTLGSLAELGARLILFGGSDATQNTLDDTWAWDGARWTEVMTPHSPPPQYGQSTATLAGPPQVVLLFVPAFDRQITATWRFDGRDWTEDPVPSNAPPALYSFGLAPWNGEVLLYGGYTPSGKPQDRTYGYDGSAWTDFGASAGPSEGESLSTPCLMGSLTP
jgi:hypothetical protein